MKPLDISSERSRQIHFADAYSMLAQVQFQFLVGGSVEPREVAPKPKPRRAKRSSWMTRWRWRIGRSAQFCTLLLEVGRGGSGVPPRAGSAARRSTYTGSVPRVDSRRRVDEALAEAERVRKLDPRSFNAHINVAVARRASGQFDRAISELRRALEMHPGRAPGHFQLGVTFVLMSRPQDAVPELERARNASPEETHGLRRIWPTHTQRLDSR